MSIFGAAAQPQTQGTGLFGSNAAASTSTNTGFGSFGAAQPQAQAQNTGGLFGSGSGTGFGAAAKPTTGLFGSSAQPAAGGFGATNTNTGGSGLFGSTNAAPGNTGTGLFGQQAGQQQQQQQQQAGGGLFGSTSAQPAAGGGLWGSTNAQPAQGGLFGSTAAKPATGLFGSSAQPGAFGASTTQNTGGLFGQANTAAPAAGGLFGAQPAAQSGGLFGSTAGAQQPGLFGSTAQPQQNAFGGAQQSVFGGAAQPQQGMFGSAAQPQQSMFASTAQPQQNMYASTAQQQQEPDISSRIMEIQNAWNVNSPDCRFKYFFYNVVDPGTAQQYGRPAGATDDAKWARAVRDNPDPNSMVPVLATGWGDVKKRVQAQEQTASVHQERVKELNTALANLSRQTTLTTSVRLEALQTNLAQLTQRLLHLAAQAQALAPPQSSTFRPEESEMKHTLEGVKDALDGRAGSRCAKSSGAGTVGLVQRQAPNRGRMLGQVNELWGAVEEVRRLRRQRHAPTEAWTGDEKFLAEIADVLNQQQQALQKLGTLASDAVFDADVIRQGLGAVEGRK